MRIRPKTAFESARAVDREFRKLGKLVLEEIERSWIGQFVEGLNLLLWEKGWIDLG